eukprot:scaffold7377_cov91-Isochrysis_galbana.AAC.2
MSRPRTANWRVSSPRRPSPRVSRRGPSDHGRSRPPRTRHLGPGRGPYPGHHERGLVRCPERDPRGLVRRSPSPPSKSKSPPLRPSGRARDSRRTRSPSPRPHQPRRGRRGWSRWCGPSRTTSRAASALAPRAFEGSPLTFDQPNGESPNR